LRNGGIHLPKLNEGKRKGEGEGDPCVLASKRGKRGRGGSVQKSLETLIHPKAKP